MTASSSNHLDAGVGRASPTTPAVDDMQGRSDAELVAALGRREEDAVAELYSRYGASVYGLADRLVNSRSAEDVTHQVFLALWHDPSLYDPDRGSLRSYLLASAHRRSVDYRRAADAQQAKATHGSSSQSERGSKALALGQADGLRTLLAELSAPQRDAILLAYFAGYTYREVADRLDQTEEVIMSNIRVGLLRLSHRLNPQGVESRPDGDRGDIGALAATDRRSQNGTHGWHEQPQSGLDSERAQARRDS